VVLDAATLSAFNVPDWNGSIARSDKNAHINDIRVFPVLRSPDAAKRIISLSLVQAFRNFVLEDPEVAALSKPLTTDAAVFKEGYFPNGLSHRWPLRLTADQCADEFVHTLFHIIGDAPRRPSRDQSRVSFALADRLLALRELLSSGKVIGRGTSSRTDNVVTIDPPMGGRAGVSIDVQNGDFCEEENNKPVVRWRSISLEAPHQQDPPQRDKLKARSPAKVKSAPSVPPKANATPRN
jgi:hypothetical protein